MTSNPTRRGVCRVCGQTVTLDRDDRATSHAAPADPLVECGGTGYRAAAGK